MLDFARFHWCTFDCYGTLIDWESGILGALRPLLARHGVQLDDAGMLALYAELEAEAERGEYRSYREVLRQVVGGFGRRLGFEPSAAEAGSLAESLGDWRPFPDTVEALRCLKPRYRLAVISNIDDELFAHSVRHLQVPFDEVITAQQAGSYKPAENNFRLALTRLKAQPEAVLHIAQSLFHDVVPARRLGLATVWVNRKSRRPGTGATPGADVKPDLEVPDLKTLAEMVVG